MKGTIRWVLTWAVLLSAVWGVFASAQKPARVYRVAYLSASSGQLQSSVAGLEEFKRTLHELGYAEGENLVIDVRWVGGSVERLPAIAAEVVASKPDVIVAFTTPVTAAAQRATSRIPIVMALVSDPVAAGFVSSLAHPGGNLTGITDYGVDLAGKFVEQAHALVPADRPIAVLMAENPVHRVQLDQIVAAAGATGTRVLPLMGRSAEEIESAFASAAKDGAKIAIVLGGPPQSVLREKIAQLALQYKLGTIAPQRTYVDAGCLLSYGPRNLPQFRMAAEFVHQILTGRKPGDMPVQRPVSLELVINLKTAKMIGLTISQSLRLRADEIVE